MVTTSEQIGNRAGMTTPVVELTQDRMPEVAARTGVAVLGPISFCSRLEIMSMPPIMSMTETSNEENNRMFKNLFLLSVANVGVNVLMAALRVFTLGGIFY